MGQEKTPFGQRVYSAMKHIREEILNHCSTINVFLVVYYTSLLGPPVGVQHLCTRLPRAIKGGRPLKKAQVEERTWRQRIDSSTNTRAIQLSVDVGYYAPAAQTTLNPRVFLCACLMSRSVVSLALPRVTTLRDWAGALRHPAVALLLEPRQIRIFVHQN